MLECILDQEKLVQFDALSHYKRYTDIFDPEEVPHTERQVVARDVADWVLSRLAKSPEARRESPCAKKKDACCG